MATKIENLFNADGEMMYPLTHTKAVVNDSGENVEQILEAGLELANQGYKFMGIAIPTTVPVTQPTSGSPKLYWEASTAGTYGNLGDLVVNEGETAYLMWNGDAWEKKVSLTIVQETGDGENVVMSQKAVSGMFNPFVATNDIEANKCIKELYFSELPNIDIYIRYISSSQVIFSDLPNGSVSSSQRIATCDYDTATGYGIIVGNNNSGISGEILLNLEAVREKLESEEPNYFVGAMIRKANVVQKELAPYVSTKKKLDILERPYVKYTEDDVVNSMIREMFVFNPASVDCYVRYITDSKQVVLTDSTLMASGRVADGYINTENGFVVLEERNSSGISGYAVFDLNKVATYTSVTAKLNTNAYSVESSPYIYSYIHKNYTNSQAVNSQLTELYLTNSKDIATIMIKYITANKQVVITDSTQNADTGRVADGYIDEYGFVVLEERNNSGVSGYALFDTLLLKVFSGAAVLNNKAFIINKSPYISSLISSQKLLGYGKKFYSLGDSIVAQEQWQNKLAKVKGFEYMSSATILSSLNPYPLGRGGSSICPRIVTTTNVTSYKCVDNSGKQLTDADGNLLYFETGRQPTESAYYRAGYFRYYTDADVVVVQAGQNDQPSSYSRPSYEKIGNYADSPYEGKEYVSAKDAQIAKYYGGEEHSIAILDDGSAEIPNEYKTGGYTILSTAPTFCACVAGMLKRIFTNVPKAKVVANTLLPSRYGQDSEPVRSEKNEALVKTCNYYQVAVADMWNEMGVNVFNFGEYFSDDYHPNAQGGERMAQIIANKL